MYTTHTHTEIDTRLEVLYPLIQYGKSFVAGGCFKDLLTDKVPRDIDVYFYNSESFIEMLDKFERSNLYSSIYESHNAVAFEHTPSGMKVELIKRRFNEPRNIINEFDFSIVQIALFQHEMGNYMLVCNPDFSSHLREKKLCITEQLRSSIMTVAGHASSDVDRGQLVESEQEYQALSLSGDKLFNRVLKYTTIHGYSLDLGTKYLLFQSIRNLTIGQMEFLSNPNDPNY